METSENTQINNNKNSKNFLRLKKISQFNYSSSKFKNFINKNQESILTILDFITSREKFLYILDINKYFCEKLISEFKSQVNQEEAKNQMLVCLKNLKEDFNKIESFKIIIFNYGFNQPSVFGKYESKYSHFILYRSVYLLSYHLFREVQQIDLQKQNMGPDSLILLNVLIKKSNSLIGLNLAYNNISDDGCKILKSCLEINKTIQSLNLECNSIGDLGLSYLTNPIVNHRTLKTLKLALNVITIVGMDSLVIALKANNGNSQINVIDFKYNNYKIESDEKYKDFKFLKISYN